MQGDSTECMQPVDPIESTQSAMERLAESFPMITLGAQRLPLHQFLAQTPHAKRLAAERTMTSAVPDKLLTGLLRQVKRQLGRGCPCIQTCHHTIHYLDATVAALLDSDVLVACFDEPSSCNRRVMAWANAREDYQALTRGMPPDAPARSLIVHIAYIVASLIVLICVPRKLAQGHLAEVGASGRCVTQATTAAIC